MPRKGEYYLNDGSKVPGVTSIIGRFDDKEGLIWWANKIGLEGQTLSQVRAEAMRFGSYGHQIFEDLVKKRLGEYPKEYKPLINIFKSELNKLKIRSIISEVQLVSEIHKFGGTPDLFIEDTDGKSWVIDYKFARNIGVGYFYQVAAYAILYEENMGKLIEGGKIFWIDKKHYEATGKFKLIPIVIENAKLNKFKEIFIEMLIIYNKLLYQDRAFQEFIREMKKGDNAKS